MICSKKFGIEAVGLTLNRGFAWLQKDFYAT